MIFVTQGFIYMCCRINVHMHFLLENGASFIVGAYKVEFQGS